MSQVASQAAFEIEIMAEQGGSPSSPDADVGGGRAAAAVAVADAVEGDVEVQTRRQREHEWLAYADDPKYRIVARISDLWQDVNATAKTSGCTQRGSWFPRALLKDIEDVDKTG